MSFTHNSTLADREPAWGAVDKTKLPRAAFAERGDPDHKSSWLYPHHWVQDAGGADEKGCYTAGVMRLHRGGLAAAWAAAQGARSGREANAAARVHLNAHREAIGMGRKSEAPREKPMAPRLLAERRLRVSAKEENDAGAGWIEGYAAVFNNVDGQGEVIRPGAFQKTVKERVAAGKVKLMVRHFKHGGDTLEVIGTVTGAREDEYGLWIHAELSSDPVAQEARAKVAEGHVSGLSIGYIPISQRETVMDGEVVLELREIKLMEVTLTPFPANELAEVTAAKSAEEGRTQTVSTPGTVAEARPAPTDWRIAIARRRLALARALW